MIIVVSSVVGAYVVAASVVPVVDGVYCDAFRLVVMVMRDNTSYAPLINCRRYFPFIGFIEIFHETVFDFRAPSHKVDIPIPNSRARQPH